MQDLFVSHEYHLNQISASYATQSLVGVFFILIVLILSSLKRKSSSFNQYFENIDFFSVETTTTLRGMAILLLCFGHFAIRCIDGVQSIEYVGENAVIIFLLVSGVALTKSYGISPLKKDFIVRRLQRLVFPLWITLILFYLLDYILLHRVHSFSKFFLSFLGIINHEPPNGPDWFVSYIIYLYSVYYFASQIKAPNLVKFLIVLFLSYLSMILIITVPTFDYFIMWNKYPIVYPLAIVVGVNRNFIFNIIHKIFTISPILYFSCMIILLILYKIDFIFSGISTFMLDYLFFAKIIDTLRNIYFILFVVFFSYIIEVQQYKSCVFDFLGKYSFEIYLLHMPFMVYYDFLLFRKPLFVSFFIYGLLMVMMSIFLKKISWSLTKVAFKL